MQKRRYWFLRIWFILLLLWSAITFFGYVNWDFSGGWMWWLMYFLYLILPFTIIWLTSYFISEYEYLNSLKKNWIPLHVYCSIKKEILRYIILIVCILLAFYFTWRQYISITITYSLILLLFLIISYFMTHKEYSLSVYLLVRIRLLVAFSVIGLLLV